MDVNIYKFAAQNGLRFPSVKGDLIVEQLFQLPLSSEKTGFDLNSVAKKINASLKLAGEESFVDDSSSNPQRKALEVALDIVKDVIATKKAENEAKAKRASNAEQRRKILDAYNAKKDAALANMTEQELEKMLASLSD